jgi:serine/threonine protein kinase
LAEKSGCCTLRYQYALGFAHMAIAHWASARAGQMQGLPGFSWQYVAPEVLTAFKSEAAEYTVTGAEDMWALGIIAFELLTDQSAFLGMTSEEIEAQILGHEVAPWEAPSRTTRERMRGFGKSVMKCLNRDPTQRPTALQVLQSWDRIFDTMKSRN